MNGNALENALFIKYRQSEAMANSMINTKMLLHNSHIVRYKIFQDRENLHAHQILKESMKPYQLVQTLPVSENENAKVLDVTINQTVLNVNGIVKEPNEIEVNNLMNNFRRIVLHCKNTDTLISNEKFKAFVEMYCSIIRLLNDEQLLEMLQLLALLPQEENVRASNFAELWNVLDAVCCQRVDQWNVNQLLLFSDAWYNLNLAKICNFVSVALRRLERRISKMSSTQLIQTMFLCNVIRRSLIEMFDCELALKKCVEEMSLDELGILAMGFFKTKTPIHSDDLINYIYRRLMKDLDKVQDITLASILKILRYSSKIAQADIMMELLNKIYEEILHKISILCCLHVALLGCELQLCHEKLMEGILKRFVSELETTRLKDLERISLAISLFNIRSDIGIEERLCQAILESLRHRIDEIIKYPKCFTNCLHYLSLRNYYDKEMLASVLDPKFLKYYKGSSLSVSRDIFHLDTFVKINLANDNYTGPQLTDKNRRLMGKFLTHYIPKHGEKYKLSFTDKILLDVKGTTDELLINCNIKHILPNYERPDVLVCYDREQQKAIQLDNNCPEDYRGIILTRDCILGTSDNRNIDTIVIVVASWNNIIRHTNRYTGLFEMKLKQLRLLQHKPLVINWHEWRDLETRNERMNLLKRRLLSIIKI